MYTDDPKLTAFALGELPDDEMQELKKTFEEHPEREKEIEEIRQTAAQLTELFAAEPVPTPILANAEKPKKKWYHISLIEAGVSCVILFVLCSLLLPPVQGRREAARRMNKQSALAELDIAGRPGFVAQLGKPMDQYNLAGTEEYSEFKENPFLKPQDAPFSTFSIDVDTASYSVMRRCVLEGRPVPKESVRLEEYINYFNYDYPQPTDGKPFATHVEVANCPWEPEHKLVKIGIKGREISKEDRPALNLVFLIDVSGSMQGSNRLSLVQRGLNELVEMLHPRDRVAIVTYAGNSRIALPSISGKEKRAILDSINGLSAGGSTAGAEGIKTAYDVARKNFTKEGQNRVILCTDGDFNVGITDNNQLETLIQKEAKSGVFLTVLGFGMGNYKDNRLEMLSDKGNGNYGYIDSIEEARKLLVENLTGTLFTIAKDVKIQVDFNPGRVGAYRLLGYENRKLADKDFHDDKKDAGEIGAGHTITALYEIVPIGADIPSAEKTDRSRYAEESEEKKNDETTPVAPTKYGEELLFVKLRYKQPDADKSELLTYPVEDKPLEMSADFRFASAVALFGMLLRESAYSGSGNIATVRELATVEESSDAYRKEFLELTAKAFPSE